MSRSGATISASHAGRTMHLKSLVALLTAIAALALATAPAGAVVTNTEGGRVSYLPLNEATGAHGAAVAHSAFPSGAPPLEYHGGPVMHSQTAYAIFWAPSGYSFPAGYTSAISGFLENVAADSGKASNVYSVSAQYTDESGHASYIDSYGGAVDDTHAYPTSGTCSTYNGFVETFTACVSDQKMEAEVELVANAQGWPTGLGAEYYVVLPPHAGSCFDGAGTSCFDVQFCAYHSYTLATERVYSNISYSPGDPAGCGVGEYPNGHANGNVDDALSSLSHEANESITDPTLEAWYDESGFENGDECRLTPFDEDFGTALGGSAGKLFNQAIGAGHYYLQQEWSNDVFDCAQRVDPATPVIGGPGQLAPGQAAVFNGGGSSSGSGGIASYSWDFGDGTAAKGSSTSHAFPAPGVFTVTLTLEDDGGFHFSATRQVTVALPGAGSGGASASGSSSAPAPVLLSPEPPASKGLKCKRGFRRTKKHGKTVCAAARKKHRGHR
jgi:PKD repeat protein